MSNVVQFRAPIPKATASRQTFEFVGERRSPDEFCLLEAMLLRENATRAMQLIGQMRAAAANNRQPIICLRDRKPVKGQYAGPALPVGEIVEVDGAAADLVLVDMGMSGSDALRLAAMLSSMGAVEIPAASGQSFG